MELSKELQPYFSSDTPPHEKAAIALEAALDPTGNLAKQMRQYQEESSHPVKMIIEPSDTNGVSYGHEESH